MGEERTLKLLSLLRGGPRSFNYIRKNVNHLQWKAWVLFRSVNFSASAQLLCAFHCLCCCIAKLLCTLLSMSVIAQVSHRTHYRGCSHPLTETVAILILLFFFCFRSYIYTLYTLQIFTVYCVDSSSDFLSSWHVFYLLYDI